MKNIQPLVSIIIPVYNGTNYVRKAIDSALEQTYQNIEVIVVNDGSTDDGETERVVMAYGDKIRYMYKPNGGVSSALNLGIREMRGKYFSWLSHDDEYHPQKIEMQIKLLSRYEDEKYLALCGTEFIDPNGKKIDKIWEMPRDTVYSDEEVLDEVRKHPLSGIALLIPKQALLDGGLFDESLRYIQDAVLWKNIFLKGYSLIVDHTIYAKSRLHGAQQTNTHRERFKEEMERTAFDFSKRYLERGYFNLLRRQWYALLEKGIFQAAKQTKLLLKQAGLLNIKTRIKGCIYSGYGKIRPLIRYVYYKIRFGISSKG